MVDVVPDHSAGDAFYREQFFRHGAVPQGVGWKTANDQTVRFNVLMSMIGKGPTTVLDVGCGYGALADFLALIGRLYEYRGIDRNPVYIADAVKRYGLRPEISFAVADVFKEEELLSKYDYVVASGTFNILTGTRQAHLEYVKKCLRDMVKAARKICAVNFITQNPLVSDAGKYKASSTYFHVTLEEVAKLAGEIHPHVIIRADYSPDDITVFWRTNR